MSAGDPVEDFFEVEGRRGPAKSATAELERHEDEPRGKRKVVASPPRRTVRVPGPSRT